MSHDLPAEDQAALLKAARSERAAKQHWETSLLGLHDAIKQASANGASLRAIGRLIGRSHARVRELLLR
jgi:hypothetical protein